jgi:hypothetical protein
VDLPDDMLEIRSTSDAGVYQCFDPKSDTFKPLKTYYIKVKRMYLQRMYTGNISVTQETVFKLHN